ncbi:cAMP-dependent protein kinase type II regulatory subunit-like [Littorina saxatilis]|uniref:cAMP-dependent protein kinase type II regulatory subunit n=1 Tax=Littorina saxatilis TaxID=31220 RepID=A0AAN9C3Z1_9CAEN
MDLRIPQGLGELLRDFTVAVLREKPDPLVDFAADYFAKLRTTSKPKSVPMYIIVDDDQAGEPDPTTLKPKNNANGPAKGKYARRTSVSAERYDPEADDGDEEKVVHDKSEGQKSRLSQAIAPILLFKSLDSEQLTDVVDAMFERRVQSGEVVIRLGDDGDNFYVIDTGIYSVRVEVDGQEKTVHTFDNKGSFGELALMYNMPRSATIMAETEGTLWAMDRASFRRIVLKAAFKKRKMYEELLENVPMLKTLESYERMNVADALQTKTFADNDVIIQQGAEADGMYFLENGSVRITINKGGGEEQQVGKLAKGKYFGELALIENKPRSANVIADGKVKVAFLQRESFERLLGPCLDLMKRNSDVYKSYANKGK